MSLSKKRKAEYNKKYYEQKKSGSLNLIQIPDVRPKLEKAGLVIRGNRILGTRKTTSPQYKRPVPKWLGF